MKQQSFIKALAMLLIITLVAPSAFLIAPQRARAIPVEVIADPGWIQDTITAVKTTFSAIKDELNLISTYTNTAANVAQQINTYVLQPLAFVMSGNLLKLITASVLDFVIGKTNGTGAPQFVQNLQGNLQRVGDIQANAFFVQFGRNSNSPFASAITSSLRTNYLWNTSSAGFFAANRNTMARYSPNPNAFLNGDWSQGGVGAWFALTTQNQNNPYTFYQASQSHLASVVGNAISARLAELGWNQGFLSWCGGTADAVSPDAQRQIFDDGSTLTTDSTGETTATNAVGINPGDPCFDKDGNLGTIKTPGSTIKAMLDESLVLNWKKLIEMGSVAKEINTILGNVGTVLGTVQFASDILGGSSSGGLFGVGQTSAANPTSRLMQYQTAPGYLGVTQSQVYQNAATLPVSGSDMASRITQYESSWNTIRSAANSASATLTGLANFCTTAATNNPNIASVATAQANAAQSAIAMQISPVLAQADTAVANIVAARAMVQKIQTELNSADPNVQNAYSADIQTLQTMPPTTLDLSNALQESQVFGTAVAIPAGALAVSGGSIIDRMALIATNAVVLKTSVCTEQQVDSGGGGGE